MTENDFGLTLSSFESLGDFADAGLQSTTLALERAMRSFDERRVPIAGAAVHKAADGTLTTIAVGCNDRIPQAGTESIGYPTDHGETSTIRLIEDIGAWDWGRVVFTTSLSPCIMCNRALTELHGLGLNKIVVAESQTFPGTKAQLKALSGMTLLELTNDKAVHMMTTFARTYPWDWNADIGMVPPAGDNRLLENSALRLRLTSTHVPNARSAANAVVVDRAGTVLATASDDRETCNGNPCRSAPIAAMGHAGSSVNLRECAIGFMTGRDTPVGVAEFGLASVGCCELFRPAAVFSDAPFDNELSRLLETGGTRVFDGGNRS